MFKELTRNVVIVVLVNVVRVDNSFLLGWTVISLLAKKIFQRRVQAEGKVSVLQFLVAPEFAVFLFLLL